MKNKVFFGLFIIFTTGCSKVFLNDEFISTLSFPRVSQNLLVYYHRHYLLKNNRLFIKTHSLIKTGGNVNTFPEALYCIDGSVQKLQQYHVRLIHQNGSIKTFSKSDLLRSDLSNSQMISRLRINFLPVRNELQSGDLIETITTFEHSLPFLGIQFTLDELEETAKNISCLIEIPLEDSLNYIVLNDTIPVSLVKTSKTKTYRFFWDSYTPLTKSGLFSKNNSEPAILAQVSAPSIFPQGQIIQKTTWQDFGNVYLDMIQSKLEISHARALAKEITKGRTGDKEKMDAIAEYCQKNIRYEQVYIDNGEFIPNNYSTIMSNRYGDCKDYSVAMYCLAKSIGLTPRLAMCHRGRGFEPCPKLPVSQFNHIIVYFVDKQTDYWYDGTNRAGQPGIVNVDLINQTALVLERDNLFLAQIAENSGNKMTISGNLMAVKNDIEGEITISLSLQFAVQFFYYEMHFNQEEFKDYLYRWSRENINENIILKDIKWLPEKEFVLKFSCVLPNSVITIDQNVYVSLSRIFSRLFPSDVADIQNNPDLFYFPYYNRTDLSLNFENLFQVQDQTEPNRSNKNFKLNYSYDLPPGPFNVSQRTDFIQKLTTVTDNFNNNVKLVRMGLP
ncbi:transglutaminase domain-containing protein [candidate division KSB1 bacterium]|nr:transglutaminase domain-containing protein [candidate division KSB1 bacterium]